MKIKLIIWDLDDTLWAGTLAEGDDVVLHAHRAEFIRRFNDCGIVSAICSKNDPAEARARMISFDLWEHTVFNRIAFVPKGAAVRDMIEDMQLRAENVLFIDDNELNLQEVRHFSPGIHVVNADDPACDALLNRLLDDNRAVRKSRVQQYRALEQRSLDRAGAGLSNEDFLRSCGIELSIVKRTDNLDFVERIEELINRTNQLNFTKSRVSEGEVLRGLTGYYKKFEAYSVFAWDRYGYHGLVGFACVDKTSRTMPHFLFSCRMMNTGLEAWVLNYVASKNPRVSIDHIPVTPADHDWITAHPFRDKVRARILERESRRSLVNAPLRIMADCQSGSIAHFAGLSDLAETDLYPRSFSLASLTTREAITGHVPRCLVYFTAADYANSRAPGRLWDPVVYEGCVRKFCALVSRGGHRTLLLLPPDNQGKFQAKIGITEDRAASFNALWREIAATHPAITLIDLRDFADASEMADFRHYDPPLLQKIGHLVRDWYDRAGREEDGEPRVGQHAGTA